MEGLEDICKLSEMRILCSTFRYSMRFPGRRRQKYPTQSLQPMLTNLPGKQFCHKTHLQPIMSWLHFHCPLPFHHLNASLHWFSRQRLKKRALKPYLSLWCPAIVLSSRQKRSVIHKSWQNYRNEVIQGLSTVWEILNIYQAGIKIGERSHPVELSYECALLI